MSDSLNYGRLLNGLPRLTDYLIPSVTSHACHQAISKAAGSEFIAQITIDVDPRWVCDADLVAKLNIVRLSMCCNVLLVVKLNKYQIWPLSMVDGVFAYRCLTVAEVANMEKSDAPKCVAFWTQAVRDLSEISPTPEILEEYEKATRLLEHWTEADKKTL